MGFDDAAARAALTDARGDRRAARGASPPHLAAATVRCGRWAASLTVRRATVSSPLAVTTVANTVGRCRGEGNAAVAHAARPTPPARHA
eukprot:gene45247-3898_t